MRIKILIIGCLVFLFSQQIQSQESVKSILDKAYNKATIENKNVFVIFHASWCGWCKKMDANMKEETTKELFDSNYVIVHIDVLERGNKKNLETPGGFDFLKKHHGEKAGLPFFLIFDANGKKIGSSFDDKHQNLGCPATEKEVAIFTKKLKETSKLSDEELLIVAKVFQKK